MTCKYKSETYTCSLAVRSESDTKQQGEQVLSDAHIMEVVYIINHMLKDYFLFLKILNNGIRGTPMVACGTLNLWSKDS